jgi:hypothetical protein
MCNGCDCENYERCSIVGHLPYGACCPSCVNYDEAHSCVNYGLRLEAFEVSELEIIHIKHEKAIEIEQFP